MIYKLEWREYCIFPKKTSCYGTLNSSHLKCQLTAPGETAATVSTTAPVTTAAGTSMAAARGHMQKINVSMTFRVGCCRSLKACDFFSVGCCCPMWHVFSFNLICCCLTIVWLNLNVCTIVLLLAVG